MTPQTDIWTIILATTLFLALGIAVIWFFHIRKVDDDKVRYRRFRDDFYFIKDKITTAGTPTMLSGIDDKIIDLQQKYLDVPEANDDCGKLVKMLEEKETDLRREYKRLITV